MNNIIIKEAKEYISNDKTLSETAKILGVSKRTLQLHFKKLSEIDANLSLLVEKKKNANQDAGRVKGGTISKATPRISKEQVLTIAKSIIRDELTYDEASLMYGIPRSTIYELVHSDMVDEDIKYGLDVVALANSKKVLVSNLGKKHGK